MKKILLVVLMSLPLFISAIQEKYKYEDADDAVKAGLIVGVISGAIAHCTYTSSYIASQVKIGLTNWIAESNQIFFNPCSAAYKPETNFNNYHPILQKNILEIAKKITPLKTTLCIGVGLALATTAIYYAGLKIVPKLNYLNQEITNKINHLTKEKA